MASEPALPLLISSSVRGLFANESYSGIKKCTANKALDINHEDADLVIVGAGMVGLALASTLQEVVYELRSLTKSCKAMTLNLRDPS